MNGRLLGLAIVCLSVNAVAQSNVITAFGTNGRLTWTSPAPYSTCRVEWAPTAGGPWSQNWNGLNPIATATNASMAASVPLFYRVICTPPPSTHSIDYARLQFPATANIAPGGNFNVYGRLYIAGLTDQSDGVDVVSNVKAEFGYGPDASSPVTNALWTWSAGVPTPSYSGSGAGEPNNDEYNANLTIAAEGTYDFAARFSGDSGSTWTYADLDGSQNGYDAAQAGSVVVAPTP